MRPIQLAMLALCAFSLGTAGAQQSPLTSTPPAKVDYSILAQSANAARINLTDQQRAAIAQILDTRVNELVAAQPDDREQIVAKSNAQIEALLSDEQKQALAASLTGGKLQFNFYQQKWGDVLAWFAKQADVSLVMDQEPPGMFTYKDTREFSPAEAIDLLNSVLLSKNFTLIRRERMLVVVDTSQGVPYDLVQQVPLEKLSDYGRFEIVTTEFPLSGRPLPTVVEAVTPLVGAHGQVIPLAAVDKLLVTETAGRLQAIGVVIESVPIPKKPEPPQPAPKPPAAVFQTYPAPGLDPEATTEVLKLLFPAAAIKFDPQAAVIHCQAVPEVQAGVSASVAKLVESVTGENKARLQTYPVPANRLSALIDQVTLAHPELVIDADPEKNRLLVVANTQEHAEVVKTLESLGAMTEPSQSDPQTVVLYPVDPVSIDGAAALLQNVIPAALVIPDVGRIAVRASSQEQELARSTIAAFTQRPSGGPQLNFYPLDQPLSSEMLAVLSAAIPQATMTWLPAEKKLSVLATQADHERIAQTLAQIKQNKRTPVTEPKRLEVTVASPAELVAMLQTRFPGTEMVLNEQSHSLHVWADDNAFESIRDAFDKISAALPQREESVMIPYALKHADAQSVLTLLMGMRPDLNAAADADSNRILVSAPLADQPRYRALIEQLDSEPDAPGNRRLNRIH